MLTGRQIAYLIYASSKFTDIHRDLGSDDLLNVEWRSENLRSDPAWEETWMTKNLRGTSWKVLFHLLESYSLMKNALALYHSDQVHRQGAKQFYKVESTGH